MIHLNVNSPHPPDPELAFNPAPNPIPNPAPNPTPLAEQLRPQNLDEVIGQDHLVKGNSPLAQFIKQGKLPSLIFWGSPGTGKTTLAQLMACQSGKKILFYSAVTLSTTELKKVFAEAEKARGSLCIFIDEIHRFNKAQQDTLLHPLESGLITLIGATTENPSFSLNSALLSRVQVLVLNRIGEGDLQTLWERGKKHLGIHFPIGLDKTIITRADGDARRLYNLMEILAGVEDLEKLTSEKLQTLLTHKVSLFDRDGEEHYNLISALHKSLRGSDVDAALYWLARMLNGGEDPHYLARRILRMAYEDIGLADPQAPQIALTAWETYQRLGSPEGEIALAQAVMYLALSPKSNRVYTAFTQARKNAQELPSEPPPHHIRNPVTKLMKNLGYGKGYRYDHDSEDSFSGQNYFPESMGRRSFYQPRTIGFEREMKRRMEYFNRLREERNSQDTRN